MESIEEIQGLLPLLATDGNVGFVVDAVRSNAVSQAALREGLGVSEPELQEAVDVYRRSLGLHTVIDTEEWLTHHSLSVEDLGRRVGGAILRARLKRHLAEGHEESYFAEHRGQFEFAAISQIVVDGAGLAEELKNRLESGESGFRRLAREHSLDEASRWRGGFLGNVRRADLVPEVADVIFECSDGDLVGPIESDRGYHLIAVEHIHAAEFDRTARNAIQNVLFGEWLDQEVERAGKSGLGGSEVSWSLPDIDIGELDPRDDREVPATRGLFRDATTSTVVLDVTGAEATVGLQRTLAVKPRLSVAELLVDMYEPLFDPLRGRPCCGHSLDECPHM